MNEEPQHSPKLNILALPNQTTILFGLIVVVLIGSVIAGSFDSQPFMWLLAVGLLLLPLRAFLDWPNREFRRYQLADAGSEFSDLTHIIQEEARTIRLARVPKLALSEQDIDPHTFGSRRRWYIGLSRRQALQLQEDLKDESKRPAIRAIILHELYHFKNGDYWQMGYTQALLRTAALFMTWAIVFLLGYGFFLLLVQPEVLRLDIAALVNQIETLSPELKSFYITLLPSAGEWAAAQQKAAEIDLRFVLYFISSAILPFIIISAVLWLFFYRKLLRIREIYADAGVIQTQKATSFLISAFFLTSRIVPVGKPFHLSILNELNKLSQNILYKIDSLLPKFVTRRFSRYPDVERRLVALVDPLKAFDSWAVTAFSLGSLALILEILLSTPLMLPYQGQWPLHFSVLAVSVVVTLALVTPLVLGNPGWRPMLKIICLVVCLRLAWLLFTFAVMLFLLVVAPEMFIQIMSAAIISVARYSRSLTGPIFDNPQLFIIEAAWVNTQQVFIVLASLILLIGGNILLLRRWLTWYSFPEGQRLLMKTAYGVIAMTTAFFGLAVLTPVTNFLLRPEEILSPLVVVGVGFGMVIGMIGLVLFLYAHRKYAGRCPRCGQDIPGPYHLGKSCDACGELLHPWLIAEYEL